LPPLSVDPRPVLNIFLPALVYASMGRGPWHLFILRRAEDRNGASVGLMPTLKPTRSEVNTPVLATPEDRGFHVSDQPRRGRSDRLTP
jgi:hypothetical protein